jgi:hypothetical protein
MRKIANTKEHEKVGVYVTKNHSWALTPISVISDNGLSLISKLPIWTVESGVPHYIGYIINLCPISDM